MRTCVARLRSRVLAAAFSAWTDAASQWVNKREAAAVALRHWELSAAAAAFATWHQEAAERHGDRCGPLTLPPSHRAGGVQQHTVRTNLDDMHSCLFLSETPSVTKSREALLQCSETAHRQARYLGAAFHLGCPMSLQEPVASSLVVRMLIHHGALYCRRKRARELVSIRTAATTWRVQAMAQAFRQWQLDAQNWRHVKRTLSCIAGTTAEALVAADFDRCASCPLNFVPSQLRPLWVTAGHVPRYTSSRGLEFNRSSLHRALSIRVCVG